MIGSSCRNHGQVHFKGRFGERGGITYKEGAQIMEEAREITFALSQLTKRLSKKVRFRYYVPEELKEIGPEATEQQER